MSATEDLTDLLAPEHRALFIAGEWREAEDGRRFEVLDPADGSVLTTVPDASTGEAVEALDAAVAAQSSWAATAPRERSDILRRAFDLITARADALAALMSLEMGKPVAEARGEVTYGADFFRWYSEEAVRIHGRWMQAPAGGTRLLTIKKPVGPCLFVTPWNFPLAMGTRKIGPAIAAGCTMVVKPAEQTPLTMLALAAILAEAGLPDGVLNVVTTTDAKGLSQTLQADDRLRKMSFTGSTAVGKVLVRQSADQLQRVEHGARRQRAVPGLRRRRRRCRGRRGDAGQDAQHGRGVHVGQQVPGARRRRRGLRAQARRTDGRADGRARPGRRGRRRAVDRREGAWSR